jgi:hypothetical protein
MANLKRSSDVRTVNAGRYRNPNAVVGIAAVNGLPIGFRRIATVQQPGSFATTRFQSVTAAKITGLSAAKMRRLARQLHPLN